MSVGNGTCDREDLRIALGALALDALDPEETSEVRRHMAGCPVCQAEYASFVGVRNVLDAGMVGGLARAKTRSAGAVDGTRVLDDRLDDRNGSRIGIDGVPAGTRGPSSGRPPRGPAGRSRGRRLAVSAMAGTSALVLAAVMFFVGRNAGTGEAAPPPVTVPSTSQPSNALPPVNQNGITAQISYQGVGWGTWVQATVTGVPADKVCTLTAYDAKGNEYVLGSWGSVPGKTLVIPAAVVLKPGEIKSFEVTVSGDGGYDINIPMV